MSAAISENELLIVLPGFHPGKYRVVLKNSILTIEK